MGEVLSNVIIPIIIIAIVIIIMLATGYVKASPDTAYIISANGGLHQYQSRCCRKCQDQ